MGVTKDSELKKILENHKDLLVLKDSNYLEADEVIAEKVKQLGKKLKLKKDEKIFVFGYNRENCSIIEKIIADKDKKLLSHVSIITIEHFCLSMILEYMKSKNDFFTILDKQDQKDIIAQIMEENSIESADSNALSVYYEIMKAKAKGLNSEQYFKQAKKQSKENQKISFIFSKYTDFLKNSCCLDTVDIITFITEHIEEKEMKKIYKDRKIAYVIFNEFQDLSPVKIKIFDLLFETCKKALLIGNSERNTNNKIIVNENIYFKKDISFNPFEEVEKKYKKIVSVERNQPEDDSQDAHIEALQKLKDKDVSIQHFGSKNEVYEIRDIIMLMRKEIFNNSRLYSDFAVMCRNDHVLDILRELFRRHDIKYKIKGKSLLTTPAVKVIFNYLQLIINNKHDYAMKNILNFPRRGIGKITRDIIEEKQKEFEISAFEASQKIMNDKKVTKKFSTVIREFVKLIDEQKKSLEKASSIKEFIESLITDVKLREEYDKVVTTEKNENIKNIEEFIEYIEKYEEKYPDRDILEFISYSSIEDEYEYLNTDSKNEVLIADFNNCRGMSVPIVFIPGLEEKFFPYYDSKIDTSKKSFEDLMRSEKMVFGLFLSTVNDSVYLSWAKERRTQEKNFKNKRSRFFDDIPKKWMKECQVDTKEKPGTETKNRYRKELIPKMKTNTSETYNKGDVVVHAMWGTGVVQKLQGKGKSAALVINFENAGEKTLLLKFAPLRKEK